MAEAPEWLLAPEPPAQGNAIQAVKFACWISQHYPDHLDEYIEGLSGSMASAQARELESDLSVLTPGFTGDPDE